MILSLSYTRPKKVDAKVFHESHGSVNHVYSEGSFRSGSSGQSRGIPESLSFDNIIKGGTCPPMTVCDFLNYLLHVEHSAENLQFYLWYRDYEKRFDAAQTADVLLSPEWTQAMEDQIVAKVRKEQAEKVKADPASTNCIFKNTDFEKQPERANGNPFDALADNAGSAATTWTGIPSSTRTTARSANHNAQAAEAFQSVGAKLPFTVQPFREEMNRIITSYIVDNAPRELNLSAWEKRATLHALSRTTHPSALRIVFKAADSCLRCQAHPNFVRWSICNGNPARVWFARALGVGLTAVGTLVAVVVTLSSMGRGYRALAAIAWVLGLSTLVAACKGMCVVLHGMHHRHVRPWELFAEEDEAASLESVGSRGNSYEDEPWVAKYEKRKLVRKIFDREVWIEEPMLRQIQDTIFVQSLIASLLMGGVLTGVFVAMPGGGLF